jgi:hypothetical protein
MSSLGVDIRVVPAEPRHIRTIAKRMRRADVEEILAASGKTPVQALAHTALINGRPEMMFGVGDLNILAGVGAPWLLGTDEVVRHQTAFLRGSRDWLDQLLQRYSVLRNFVDDRNKVSIRWLKWLGFSLLDPVDMGGHAFRLFELRSPDV